MELNKTKKWFYALTALAVFFILALGGWWLFLVFKLANKLESMHIPELSGNLLYMIQWEGFTFFSMLVILGSALLYIFIQDHRKTLSISSFFASMTHELKTPLASIRLQAQVIADLVDDLELSSSQLEKYVQRLNDDTVRLENELDKSLQLARIEKGGVLNLVPIGLESFIEDISSQYISREKALSIDIKYDENFMILADEFALKMILRNLIENTLRHCHQESKQVTITLQSHNKNVLMNYFDNGLPFTGDKKKLGQLFYKYNSPKGSGIGLYLIKQLIKKMGGHFKIIGDDKLTFSLEFVKEVNHATK